ncbi:unnamed protein product [Arabidopsis halleri]
MEDGWRIGVVLDGSVPRWICLFSPIWFWRLKVSILFLLS